MRHKGGELEMGSTKKRQSKRGGLDNVIPRSQETALTIRKNERAQWSRGGEQHGDKP